MNTDKAIQGVINVAVSIDRNYVQPLGVMLNSLLVNTKRNVHICLLHSDLEEEHIAMFGTLISQHDHASIGYHQIKSKEIDGFSGHGHITNVTYYRFLLPQILPTSEDKVIYLDPDLVVLSDIETLWNVELADALLAAVPVLAAPREKIVAEGEGYFNAGVMLINLRQWRECDVMGKSLETAVSLTDYIELADQDILNVITRHRWEKLPLCWNKRSDFYLNKGSSIYSRDEIETARKDMGIIHFTGPVKPWHYACSHPEQGMYLKYKKGTPWESELLIGRNLISSISRNLPFSLNVWLSRKLAHSLLAKMIKRLAFKK